ncbi:SMYD [Lepeophtheirus salmonis]|uniref:SMYD n=1 Tax=Lepeophtheirus salmonis TaxID=72036 RepID=A0A7R8CV37_LEPSM|nr:SMYD [Lepeophtheirus salmonis]CAF2941870.1 SMYD [Lepeophtheirus salmonis]
MFHVSCDPHDPLEDFLARDILDPGSERSYRIKFDSKEGRYLVASKDIEPGEDILTEEALFWSPRYSTRPLCLVCYGYLYNKESCYICECGWPLCSEECLESAKTSDHVLECSLYTSHSQLRPDVHAFNFLGVEPSYDVVGPVRLLSKKGSSKWYMTWKLMSHLEDWKKIPGWIEAHHSVMKELKALFTETTDEEILTIFGIFYTNDFGVRVNAGVDGNGNPVLCPKIRQLYTLTSLLSHDFKAKRRISKGEKITGTYVDVFAPTIVRKKVLKESKLFDCTCKRCSEAQDGVGGSDLVVKNHIQRALKKLLKYYGDLEEILEDPESCTVQAYESFISTRKKELHPHNLIFIRLMYSLSGFYGRLSGYEMPVMTEKMLRRKWEIGEVVMKALDTFDLGISSYKGMIDYELHMPMIMLTKMELDAGYVEYDKAKDIFQKALTHLKASLSHLQYENPMSFEGQIYAGASLSLVPLDSFISQI